MSRVPVAVVGAGNMGRNHLRVYDELPGAELVEVVDPDGARAAEVTEEYDVPVYDDVGELSAAEAATVAAPTPLHRPVAERLFEAGLDLLVEKPLANTVADAEAIAERAEAHDAVLAVGHIERFNPAVETLGEVLAGESVIALEAHRLGPFNEHLTEESVVLDLMIHDIDVVGSLVGTPVDRLDAMGAVSRSNEVDYAVATLQYDDGTIATLTSSHVTHGKVRTLDVTTRDAFISMDYQDQSLTIQRRGAEETTQLGDRTGYRTESVTQTPFIQRREPLRVEIEQFLAAVRGEEPPRVGPEDGVEAVRLASEVVRSIREE